VLTIKIRRGEQGLCGPRREVGGGLRLPRSTSLDLPRRRIVPAGRRFPIRRGRAAGRARCSF